jgi:hypothetical protein
VVSQDIPGLLKNMTEVFSIAGAQSNSEVLSRIAQVRVLKQKQAALRAQALKDAEAEHEERNSIFVSKKELSRLEKKAKESDLALRQVEKELDKIEPPSAEEVVRRSKTSRPAPEPETVSEPAAEKNASR